MSTVVMDTVTNTSVTSSNSSSDVMHNVTTLAAPINVTRDDVTSTYAHYIVHRITSEVMTSDITNRTFTDITSQGSSDVFTLVTADTTSVVTSLGSSDDSTFNFGGLRHVGPSVVLISVAALVFLMVVLSFYSYIRRHHQYEKLPTGDTISYDYIYRPLQGNMLDDEYENTFVGVSIPLLQDNTRI